MTNSNASEFNDQPPHVKNIHPNELYNLLETLRESDAFNKSLTLVDVRERSEIESQGRIEGAVSIPWGLANDQPEFFDSVIADLPKDRKTIFQCRSGRRSGFAALRAIELGFTDVYNLVGGLIAWEEQKLPIQKFANNHSPWVHIIFDPDTETAQYVVTDVETKEAYVIDPVLDYDPFSSSVKPVTAKKILEFVAKHGLHVTKIIDTHVHADHLTAAIYLKKELPSEPEFWIGANVTAVQDTFAQRYNFPKEQLSVTGEQFDHLVGDGETWTLGKNIQCSAINTPGHTPACVSYRIGDAAFVGDTLFMPDIGTARCDFPGGSAQTMYDSIHRMYNLWPDDTRIFVGHDYPTPARTYEVVTTLGAHKRFNKMISLGTSIETYVKLRTERDSKLRAPRYIHPSLQTNLRGGYLPDEEVSVDGTNATAGRFFKIPVQWQDN